MEAACFDAAHPTSRTPAPLDEVEGLVKYERALMRRHSHGTTFVIAQQDEAPGGENDIYDLMVETSWDDVHNGGPNLYFPIAARDFFNENRIVAQKRRLATVKYAYNLRFKPPIVQQLIKRAELDVQSELSRRTHFCAFMFSKCDSLIYDNSPHVVVRTALFDVVSEKYKQVDALGEAGDGTSDHPRACRVTDESAAVKRQVYVQAENENYWLASVNTYTSYKFVIAFENCFTDGYFTEKFMNAILAGAIPIYAGNRAEPKQLQVFNPGRYIYCQFDDMKDEDGLVYGLGSYTHASDDGKDPEARVRAVKIKLSEQLQECAEKIQRVDQDDVLYGRMINTPVLRGNTLNRTFFVSKPGFLLCCVVRVSDEFSIRSRLG